MRYGIHLPQHGRAVEAGGIARAAALAERLGFDDVWVGDHLVAAATDSDAAAILYDPIVALSAAAAVTERVGLGTGVLVGPQYTSPLALANSLASLDHLSGGRLILGIGVGHSRAEFDALHAPWEHRGARLEEILDLFQVAWRDDPATHVGEYYSFDEVRVLPKPAHEIPIWLGGGSDAAFERAFRRGNGFHAIGYPPDTAGQLVQRIRAARPEEAFTISLQVPWDARDTGADQIRAERDAYRTAGIQHLVAAPVRGSLASWLDGMSFIASALGLPGS